MRQSSQFIIPLGIFLLSCKSQNQDADFSKTNKISVDTLKLYHQVKDLFYSKGGHLYQLTTAQIVDQPDTLHWREYLNGKIPQDLDPISFEQMDGWYAKDKNFVYYYRPVSGGMLIVKIENADVNTFKILKGYYRYAMDRNHVYEELNIIEDLSPTNLKVNYDTEGKPISLQSGTNIYKTN
jgi:DKNYY family